MKKVWLLVWHSVAAQLPTIPALSIHSPWFQFQFSDLQLWMWIPDTFYSQVADKCGHLENSISRMNEHVHTCFIFKWSISHVWVCIGCGQPVFGENKRRWLFSACYSYNKGLWISCFRYTCGSFLDSGFFSAKAQLPPHVRRLWQSSFIRAVPSASTSRRRNQWGTRKTEHKLLGRKTNLLG